MRIIYARGFPYGAPLAMVRGGATRDQAVKDFLRAEGFRWDGQKHAWASYMYAPEFRSVLVALRDTFGCTVEPKQDMDESYVIDLQGGN